MNKKEILQTPVWQLYEKGRNYHRMTGIYTDSDRNYRFYNGDQWEGAKLGGVEPIQQNFIMPIVKYKCGIIHDNLYAINYSSENYDDMAFQREAEQYCDMLNRYAHRVWEKDKLDFKGRRITNDAAINDEGVLYVNFDKATMMPVNEVVKKSDIYYGNENDDDIQSQPYILIRKRMPVPSAIDLAHSFGVTGKDDMIIGDNDTFEESGDAAKVELDNQVTVVYKLYKKKGTVHFSAATRYVTLADDEDLAITLYPVAHFVWEEKEGSARGEGEVRRLIPNQIEVNRTLLRMAITAKQQAYPLRVADRSKIANPSAVDTVGGVVWTNGQTVDDVRKVLGTIPPAQMSSDVYQLKNDLVQVTRDLAGAGEVATGQINPESASGRAILAVMSAAQQPLNTQKEFYKNFVEDLAKIWLEYLIVHAQDGVQMEKPVTDPQGNKYVEIVTVPQAVLKRLQATVKIDVTPKGVYDKFAQEQTIENLLMNGLFTPNRVNELSTYAEVLDDDSVAPKMKILEAIEHIKAEQQKIAQIETQAQAVQQRARQFLSGSPNEQMAQMSAAANQLKMQGMTQQIQ